MICHTRKRASSRTHPSTYSPSTALGIPGHVLLPSFTRSMFDRGRAIPYSNRGVERETGLEPATLTLAR